MAIWTIVYYRLSCRQDILTFYSKLMVNLMCLTISYGDFSCPFTFVKWQFMPLRRAHVCSVECCLGRTQNQFKPRRLQNQRLSYMERYKGILDECKQICSTHRCESLTIQCKQTISLLSDARRLQPGVERQQRSPSAN